MLQSMRGGGRGGRGKGRLLVNKYSCCFNVNPALLERENFWQGTGTVCGHGCYAEVRRHVHVYILFPYICFHSGAHVHTVVTVTPPPLSNWLSVLCALQEWLFLYFSLPSPHSLHESLTPPLPVLSFNTCTSPSLPLPSLPAHGHYPPDLSDKIAPPSGQPTQCIRLKNMFETIK